MTQNSNLIRQHILWRGLYFFSILLVNIGIARFFAAEKSGRIFFIINNLALILLVVSISLESGSAFYLASGKLEAVQIARFSTYWAAGASLIALALWLALLYFSHSVYLTDLGFIIGSFLFIIGVLFTTYFTALFYALKQFGLPNKILFLSNVGLILFLIILKNNSIVKSHFIQVYFFSFFLQGILLGIIFFSRQSLTVGTSLPDHPLLKKVIRYSLAALIANLVYFLVNRVDYWFVQYYCSAKDLGNYIQASKLGQMLVTLPAILGATLFPIFSSGGNSDKKNPLTTTVRILFWINSLICILIVFSGWFIFPFVFGTTFNNLYLLFILLIPGILCITMNYPVAAWFSSEKKIGVNIRGSLLALIVICAGDAFALPRYGVLAASIVSSAGYFSCYYYILYVYRKQNFVSWKDFFLIRKSDISHIRRSIGIKTPEAFTEFPIQ